MLEYSSENERIQSGESHVAERMNRVSSPSWTSLVRVYDFVVFAYEGDPRTLSYRVLTRVPQAGRRKAAARRATGSAFTAGRRRRSCIFHVLFQEHRLEAIPFFPDGIGAPLVPIDDGEHPGNRQSGVFRPL